MGERKFRSHVKKMPSILPRKEINKLPPCTADLKTMKDIQRHWKDHLLILPKSNMVFLLKRVKRKRETSDKKDTLKVSSIDKVKRAALKKLSRKRKKTLGLSNRRLNTKDFAVLRNLTELNVEA